MTRRRVLAVAGLLLATACAEGTAAVTDQPSGDEGTSAEQAAAPAAEPSTTETSTSISSTTEPPAESTSTSSTAPPTTAPGPPPTTTAATTTTAAAPAPPPGPPFAATISAVTEAELGPSWRAGCPVPVEDLRRIDMTHWNDDGAVADGVLVVHADHADALVGVFARLYDARFPIHTMQPVVAFAADDNASMTANNTSAFNCREIAGRPGVWSQHSYGGAVDINPLVNPWVQGSQVDPPQGAPYVDRTADAPGLIRAGDVVTQAFADIGWGWGGNWTSSKDYQHFSHNGR